MLSGLKNRNFIVYKVFTLTIFTIILVIFSILISFKYNKSFSKTYYEEKRYNNSEDGEEYLNKKFDKVSSDSPAITVLTHGVEGKASHWSNLSNYSEYFNDNEEKKHKHKLYKFAYTENSLIQRICDVTNANLYHVVASKKSNNRWNYKFKNLSLQQIDKSTVDGRIYDIYSNNYPEGDPRENKLFEISKHSVVVFSLDSKDKSNDIVYEEFKYSMNRIITDFANINNGIAPRINLIGHSRGGLTNFQYMLDYPELVANFYSIGTPFCGSNTLDLANELGLSKFTVKKSDDMFYDLYVNYGSKKWQEYIERWNENYNKKYKHINAHAIGGYSSLATFLRLLAMSENVLGGKLEFVKYIPGFLIDCLWEYLYSKFEPFMKIINEFCESPGGLLGKIQSVERFIEENIQPNIENIFRNDGLVGLDSQLGQCNGYYLDGFKRHQIKYNISDSRHKKLSEDNYTVVHNMEARSYQVINYIMDNLDFGVAKDDFMTTNLSDGTIGIVQYVGEKKDVYVVPKIIKDKPVSVIFEGAFEFADIRKIILPATIREIREGAFANNRILNEIDMGNLDMNRLNSGIFENCTYLQHVKFPKNLEVIGERCFVNTGLERIKIPNTVVAI